MGGYEDLGFGDGGEGFEDDFEGVGVDSVLGLFNHVDAARRGEGGGQGEGQHPQDSVAEEPVGAFEAAFEVQDEVFGVVGLAGGPADGFEVFKGVAEVVGPAGDGAGRLWF